MGKKRFAFFLLFLYLAAQALVSCSPAGTRLFPAENALPSSPVSVRAEASAQDVPGESARQLIAYGIIAQDAYAADGYLSRLTAAQIVADVTGLRKPAEESAFTHPFIDLSEKSNHLIGYLYHNGIADGISNNRYMEDELCDLPAFLVLLMRAMDFAGGVETDVSRENAVALAAQRGILVSAQAADTGVLSVGDSFDICLRALQSPVGAEGETLLRYLVRKGVARTPVAQDSTADAMPVGKPFYRETFEGKRISPSRITDGSGKTCWYGNAAPGAANRITDDGYLELSGEEQRLIKDQRYALGKDLMQGNESYAMTFTVNVQRMANEGNENRVIFRVVPRTLDADFTKYYAVNYYMVMPLGEYQANLARCKWTITNTNAPSGTAPLAEAWFLLKENADYTARLLIENIADGVHIAFYIDGADRFATKTEPLLEYTDTSEYKILQSAAGPALESSGYQNAGWGYASTVRFDDVALYDVKNFATLTERARACALLPSVLAEGSEYANQLRYLTNNGVPLSYLRSADPAGGVSVANFLASALYLNGTDSGGQTPKAFAESVYGRLFKGTEAERNTDLSRAVTRYEAAQIIKGLLRGKPASGEYRSLYADSPDAAYAGAVWFAVQNSYLLLDGQNRFNGNQPLTCREAQRVFACAADPRLRELNRELQVAAVCSNNAVLQAGKPFPVSGRGMNGDTVTVSLGDQTRTARVADGKWALELDSRPYGGPYTLTIRDSGSTLSYSGIYYGEVFVVAGQSNAEMTLYEADNNSGALRRFNNQSQVRLFSPVSRMATTPLTDTQTKWQVPSDAYSEHIFGGASAIGVFTVQKLLDVNPQLKNVKIGLMQMTYGGTSIEMFMPDGVAGENGAAQPDDAFIASGFWNGFMDGVTPCAARALIYYQGENSAHLQYIYEPLLRDYIRGVRQKFYDPALPVLLVQLAGYGENYGQENDLLPYIREIQMRVANTTQNVGLVTAIDLSDKNPNEIHPKAKQAVGERLACLAMDMLYGRDVGGKSPAMTGYTREGNAYRITFSADSLVLEEGVWGDIAFEALGPDGKWSQAQARIENGTLLVWSDTVAAPQGVRYAWANYPKACLFDGKGLPVLPFNTSKDLGTAIPASFFETSALVLQKPYHLLGTGDAVINLTRGGALRHVAFTDPYRVTYTDGEIGGQSPGDQVILLKRQGTLICESGTAGTVLKIPGHALRAGDWLLAAGGSIPVQVLEVSDADAVLVSAGASLRPGDMLEAFRNAGKGTAQ